VTPSPCDIHVKINAPPHHHKANPKNPKKFPKPSLPQEESLTKKMAAKLLALPRELLVTLFELLDPDTSTCLGLTCKPLYEIHTYTFHLLNKSLLPSRPGPFQPSSQLPSLLSTWMGPNLIYGAPYTYHFITTSRLSELKREMIPWLEDYSEWQQMYGAGERIRSFPDPNGRRQLFWLSGPGYISQETETSGPYFADESPIRFSMKLLRGLERSAEWGWRVWIPRHRQRAAMEEREYRAVVYPLFG